MNISINKKHIGFAGTLLFFCLFMFQTAPQVAHADYYCGTDSSWPGWSYCADEPGNSDRTTDFVSNNSGQLTTNGNYGLNPNDTQFFDQDVYAHSPCGFSFLYYSYQCNVQINLTVVDTTPLTPPTVNLYTSSNNVQDGTPITLSWNSANAWNCWNNFSGDGNGADAVQVWPPSDTYTVYYEACSNGGGTNVAYQGVSTYGLPDLVGLTGGTAYGTVGSPVNLPASLIGVVNQGPGATSGAFWNLVQITLSDQATVVDQLQPWGAPLAAWASEPLSATTNYTFPNPGTYYYRLCANLNTSWQFTVPESNYGNNCSAWSPIIITGQPDLTVGSAPTVTVTLGQSIPLSGTVINQGNASTGSGFDNIFLTNLNAQGTAWNTIQDSGTAPALGPYGASEGIGITLPASTFSSPGSYLYAYCANFNASWATSVAESNYNNNCVVGTINVSAPPITACTVNGSNSPANVTAPATVSYAAVGGATPYVWTPSDSVGSYGSASTASRNFTSANAGNSYGMQVSGAGGSASCPLVNVAERGVNWLSCTHYYCHSCTCDGRRDKSYCMEWDKYPRSERVLYHHGSECRRPGRERRYLVRRPSPVL